MCESAFTPMQRAIEVVQQKAMASELLSLVEVCVEATTPRMGAAAV